MTAALAPGGWLPLAACKTAEPDLFFPISSPAATGGSDAARALAICGSCPVRAECLEYAMATSQVHGIWGGTTEEQRLALRR
jgi:WhiB family transcriptional regulator, redox-sensing transcriptional regulator